jgi:hypothetical protein
MNDAEIESDEFLLEINLPADEEITTSGQRLFLEKTVRHQGVWRVHKSDPDKVFPSDFHADRVDGAEKLDLYTGQVYSKSNKQLLYSLSKASMRFIFKELMGSKELEIQTKLADESRFGFLN